MLNEEFHHYYSARGDICMLNGNILVKTQGGRQHKLFIKWEKNKISIYCKWGSFRQEVEYFYIQKEKITIDEDKEVCWTTSKRNMGAHSRWMSKPLAETEGWNEGVGLEKREGLWNHYCDFLEELLSDPGNN